MKKVLFILLLFPVMLAAQQTQSQPPSQQNDKNILELPEFIIKGNGSLDIKAVRKEKPGEDWDLDSGSLASLHPVVGAPLPTREADSLRVEKAIPTNHLLLHAEMGIYNTPDGWLQYQTTFSPFDFYARAEGYQTNGSNPGVAYQTADPSINAFGFNAGAGWRVPDNVMYFGNARVGVDADLHSTVYNVLYGADSAVPQTQSQRQIRNGGMSVGLDQDAGAMQFNFRFTSRGYKVQDATSNADNLFGMRGGISFIGTNWMVKGNVLFKTYNTSSAGRSFSEIHAEADRLTGAFRYALGGSLFSAQNNIYNAETFIAPMASIQYALSHAVEFFADFAPRMRDETMQGILAVNPYVGISALDSIQYPYEPVNIAAGIRSSGETPVDAEAKISFVRTNNDRIFRLIGTNEWSLDYENTSTLRANVQASWRITAQDVATAMVAAQSNTVVSSGNAVPYVPSLEANIGYSHDFSFSLTLDVDADILGARNATPDGSQALPAVALLNAHAEYRLLDHLSITADMRNILDQTYVVWNGYPAMKIFAALGVTAAL